MGENVNISSSSVPVESTKDVMVSKDSNLIRESLNSNGADQQPISGEQEEKDNKASLKSKVWDHFQRIKVNGNWKAKCIHCKHELAAGSKNGTSSLKNHVESHCKKVKLLTSKQATIHNVLARHVSKKEASNFDQERSRKELASMIILHEYPLSIVNHIGFRRFLSNVQPLFKCPSRNTTKKDILGIYNTEKLDLMKKLDKIEGRVAITSDMWTSNQMKGFMVVTAHMIDNAWNLHSRILSFTYVPTPHTSEALCDALMKTLIDWNIDRRLSTITLDNCSTNDSMIDDLLGRLDENYLWLRGKLMHMRCCAHILNLIVQDGLDVVKEAISTIRNSVLYWTATPKRVETFISACTRIGVPVKKKVEIDCKTRWNSTYLMFMSARLYKDVFPRLKQIDHHYKCLPTMEEWELAELLCDRLKVFYDVTLLFSGTQYPTANLYFDKVCEIKLALLDWMNNASLIIRDMAIKMSLKFDKYWSCIHYVMGVAAVLDPRYKIDLLEFYYQEIYGDASRDEIGKVKQICVDLMNEYQEKNTSSSLNEHSSEPSTMDTSKLAAFSRFVQSKKRGRSTTPHTELDIYLDEDILPMSSDFNLLMWWKINGVKYPTLQKIAKDIFAIPVSTVASESAFSTGGRIISSHRSKLKENTIQALMCAQNWLWACEKDGKTITFDDYVTINEELEEDGGEFSMSIS